MKSLNSLLIIVVTSIVAMVLNSCSTKTPVLDVVDNVNVVEITTNDESTNILFFGDNYYSYRLEFNGKNIKLIYTFQKYDPIIYYGNFIDGEIIVDGCDYCYKFENTACDGCQLRWEFCVYNGETDGYDCYSYDDSKSNRVVMDLF